MCSYPRKVKEKKDKLGSNSSLIMQSPERDRPQRTLPSPPHFDYERRLKQLRRHTDWTWFNVCIGVVEGDNGPVESRQWW